MNTRERALIPWILAFLALTAAVVAGRITAPDRGMTVREFEARDRDVGRELAVIHDDAASVTCWLRDAGGIACLPDAWIAPEPRPESVHGPRARWAHMEPAE